MPIYLDYAASTPADEQVVEAMCRCMRETTANPSAAYSAAGSARRELRLCRQTLAGMLHCDPTELFFTSGGTEANNWAMLAHSCAAVSALEHPSVLNAAPEALRIAADAAGIIRPEAVEMALQNGAKLISVQWANNETGVIQPIAEISRLVRRYGALLHVDAVQAFGHVPVDARLCDLLSLSAHKLYGPRGAGCLYVRSGVQLKPLLYGGGQENGMRAGTENVAAICGLRAAAELAQADMEKRASCERALMDAFVKQIEIPGLRLLGKDSPRLPGIAALYLPGLPAEQAIADLDLAGIEISGGAACHARSAGPSHVYTAMGLSEMEARCVVRISIGRGIAADDLTQAAGALSRVWAQRVRPGR